MKVKILLLFLFLFLFPTAAFAGEVYGTLKEGDKPVGANIRVEIVCGRNPYSAQTDQYGSYRLYVRDLGPCTLRVAYKNQTPELAIQSYSDPERYDFQLVPVSGRYVLRRT